MRLIQLGCSYVLESQIVGNFQANGMKDWSESYRIEYQKTIEVKERVGYS